MKLSIVSVNEKETKDGDEYLLVDTDNGKMSVFDSSLFKDIRGSVGKEVEVETKTSGKYTNIVDFVEVLGVGKKVEGFGREPEKIIKTDCHRMAVDLCIAGKIDLKEVIKTANEYYMSING